MMKTVLYDWGGANVWLFHIINNVRGSFVDWFMLLGTRLGNHSYFPYYLAMAVVLGIVLISRTLREDPQAGMYQALQWLAAICVFSLCYVIDGTFIKWLKPMLNFPRPPMALPSGTLHILGTPEFYYSLPSGHASFAMLFAASFWPVLNPIGRIFAGALVFWVGLSRISVGAHFPADVFAGWLSSLLIVLMVSTVVNKILLSKVK
jgi:membrane-associated phospholipid phosphatase